MAAGLCACNDEYTFVPEYEVKLPTDTTINVQLMPQLYIRQLMVLHLPMHGIWNM